MLSFDLLDIWETKIFPAGIQNLPNAQATLDDKFVQASFEVSGPTKVTFVNEKGQAVTAYNKLDKLHLSEADQLVVISRIEKLKRHPKFEDRDQLLVTKAIYNTQDNSIFLEAVRTKYSVLNTLAARKFKPDSDIYKTSFYKTGVMTPFITSDDYTFFMERAADKLYSAASGFLEPIGEEQQLSDGDDDLVVWNAKNEVLEEFLWGKDKMPRYTYLTPQITGISIRKTAGGIGTIEFVAPMFLPYCNKANLERLLQSNVAPDKYEHTDKFISVTLESCNRQQAIGFLKEAFPGGFLYGPMLVGAVRCMSKVTYGDIIPGGLPHSRSIIIPLESLRQGLSLCVASDKWVSRCVYKSHTDDYIEMVI